MDHWYQSRKRQNTVLRSGKVKAAPLQARGAQRFPGT